MTTIIIRDPHVIAAEINTIKDQTIEYVHESSFKIGKKLIEAKQSVGHGEWANWLEEYVNYSQSAANKIMKFYEEYGKNSNSELITNLGYTHALALMGLPSEDREEFLKENDTEKMSVKDFKQAIKDKQRLEKELKDAQDAAEADHLANEEALEAAEADSQLLINQHNELVLKLNTDLEAALKTPSENGTAKKLKADLDKAKADLAASVKEAKELKEKLKKVPVVDPAAKAVIPEETQNELETLRKAQEDHAAQILQKTQEAEQQIKAMQEQLAKNDNTELIGVRDMVKMLSRYFEATLEAVNDVKNPDEKIKFKENLKILLDRLKAQVE
jgi:hypothetical protein